MPPKPHDAQTDEHPHSQSYSCFPREGDKKKDEKRDTLERGPLPAGRPAIANVENIARRTPEAERPVASTCRSYPGINWLWRWEVLGNLGAHPTVGVLFTHWRAPYYLIQLARRRVRPKNFEKLKRLLKRLPLDFLT